MQAQDTETDLAVHDLGPLAWVQEELRKSLEASSTALRRFVRDTRLAQASGGSLEAPDSAQLRLARQHLHQALGALEMVGLQAPARLLRAMETGVQRMVERPELCTEAAARQVEQAGHALTEFLDTLLVGRRVSGVALFPQYRDMQALAGVERAHPADLWSIDWRWRDPATPPAPQALPYAGPVRARMDPAVLRIVKSGDAGAARELARICQALAAGQADGPLQARAFWKICAGFFEALSLSLLPSDVHVKRAASRVLVQYAQLAKGEQAVSERLAQDLVFFCARAVPMDDVPAPLLQAVRQAWSLDQFLRIDYDTVQFGRFDPALLAQLRKRIGVAREAWAAVAGGDASRLRSVAEVFRGLGESLMRLHPATQPLAEALTSIGESVLRAGQLPPTELAIEVATAVLFLEAAFQDLDPDDARFFQRTRDLAGRLQAAQSGAAPRPLDAWMEELYRGVSDRQTMGSVVGELRVTLGELEKDLDTYFRDPANSQMLRGVPLRLSQMRGVLSVLGLEQAAHAVQRMRADIEALLANPPAPGAQVLEHGVGTLGHNLGALGFLIDMLNYQPVLAKKLFVLDEATGELRPLMGRTVAAPTPAARAEGVAPHETRDDPPVQPQPVSDAPFLALDEVPPAPATLELPASAFPVLATEVEPSGDTAVLSPEAPAAGVFADEPAMAPALAEPAPPPTVAAPAQESEIDDELLEIFLEEARGVVVQAREALAGLGVAPQDTAATTVLRRAFHTLKGSARMVGLSEFGEAAWSLEQVYNEHMADQRPAAPALLALTSEVVEGFARWVEAIADHDHAAWRAAPVREAAQALRQGEQPNVPVFPGRAGSPVESVDVVEVVNVVELADAVDSMELQEPTLAEDDFRASVAGVEVNEAPLEDFEWEAAPADALRADTPPGPEVESEPEPEPELGPAATLDLAVESAEVPEAPTEPAAEESVRIIGSLHIGIPLYNVFLNEADEWSRRLQVELSEWALELAQPLPDSAVAMAHSLAGSSATVGFHALSEVARLLEQSLQRTQGLAWGTTHHGEAFNNAAEEIRRLLHQFAAGFLKEPDPGIAQALHALEDLQVPLRVPESVLPPDSALPADAAQVDEAVDASGPELVAGVPAAAAPAALPDAVRHRAISLDDERQGIDVADAIDCDLFAIFEEEAAELLPQMGGALRQWSARPENLSARDALLRGLHTLKGSARLAGALRLGEMAHRMEALAEQIGGQAVTEADVEPLLQRFDQMQAAFDALRARSEGAAGAPADTAAAAPMPAPAAVPAAEGARSQLAAPVQTSLAAQRVASTQAVRVRSQLLDRLVNQAGEVMITRSRLENELRQLRVSLNELTGNLDRLRGQLRDIDVQSESQMQSRMAQAKDSDPGFDPLEFDRFTRVQELTRMMAESVNDIATVQRQLQRTVEATEDDLAAQARQTRELQRDLLRTRMVEFEGIADRLYRVVRQASKDTGRQVKLDIDGGSIEVDRGVLDRMTPSFEHLLRNCVAHGIEDAQVRVAAGKDPMGHIVVRVSHEGNDVSVEVADDGAGLDLRRIHERAVEVGLVRPGQVLSDEEATRLIFMPGFSTAGTVTEIAGRGIGMDVVRAEINALGGRIETESRPGQGTRFRLVLPLTTAVTQVVMIRSGKLSIGVPANLVEVVRRASSREVQQAYNAGVFEHDGEWVPFYWSGALLQASRRSDETPPRSLPVVVFRSAAQRIALHVDEVLGSQEVVVKNLGPQLSRLPGLAGMTVLPSGAVVLIYNPVALATVHGEQARLLSADHAQPEVLEQAGRQVPATLGDAAAQTPLVLVVDDSITVRRVTQRLLQREGYRVALAVDGLQALEKLAEETPAVVLSDIEMPRMDGFDLARNIRSDARWSRLPIVMITSRIAPKHREHAREIGVDRYLGKPYSEEELLSLLRHYCGQAA